MEIAPVRSFVEYASPEAVKLDVARTTFGLGSFVDHASTALDTGLRKGERGRAADDAVKDMRGMLGIMQRIDASSVASDGMRSGAHEGAELLTSMIDASKGGRFSHAQLTFPLTDAQKLGAAVGRMHDEALYGG